MESHRNENRAGSREQGMGLQKGPLLGDNKAGTRVESPKRGKEEIPAIQMLSMQGGVLPPPHPCFHGPYSHPVARESPQGPALPIKRPGWGAGRQHLPRRSLWPPTEQFSYRGSGDIAKV
ncbi:hypothetical protein H1C71_021446 [Ictidomys tridecemlineatus]|nr:hypothetical protein H1C71_021446 [Ictidomys tridecemlineatus]